MNLFKVKVKLLFKDRVQIQLKTCLKIYFIFILSSKPNLRFAGSNSHIFFTEKTAKCQNRTYHTETWQGAIYYDPNKYYKAYEPICHSLTDSLID